MHTKILILTLRTFLCRYDQGAPPFRWSDGFSSHRLRLSWKIHFNPRQMEAFLPCSPSGYSDYQNYKVQQYPPTPRLSLLRMKMGTLKTQLVSLNEPLVRLSCPHISEKILYLDSSSFPPSNLTHDPKRVHTSTYGVKGHIYMNKNVFSKTISGIKDIKFKICLSFVYVHIATRLR